MDCEEEGSWEDYESGPFCKHWSTPGDCDECKDEQEKAAQLHCPKCGSIGVELDLNDEDEKTAYGCRYTGCRWYGPRPEK